jgi:pilus assembly protein Flp/PilA
MRVLGSIMGFIRFIGDERAATAIEYSLMAAGIGLAVATTVMSLGSTVKSTFYDRLMALM